MILYSLTLFNIFQVGIHTCPASSFFFVFCGLSETTHKNYCEGCSGEGEGVGLFDIRSRVCLISGIGSSSCPLLIFFLFFYLWNGNEFIHNELIHHKNNK